MQKHRDITEQKISNAGERLRQLIYSPFAPLEIAAHHIVGEPILAEEALKRNYQPFAVGGSWGPAWDTTWFRFSGTIPKEWKGREVIALVKLGSKGGEGFTCEGLVWRDGAPIRAINVQRSDIPLSSKAKGGEKFSFYVEAAANPASPFHRAYDIPEREGDREPLFALEQAELACFNRDAWDFWHDFQLAARTMRALPEKEPRRGQLLRALNNAVNLFDESDTATLKPARAALKDVLNRKNGDTVHQISAVGHAHIDTAWLWPLRETIRKCARTFSTALAYMEEYPDYVFACSQPQQYAWMKQYYPAIYEGIKKAVRRGQWEPIGSMWIEADCNLSSGEALVRQIIHGKNFFLDEFGIETIDVWIPDVFGYCAALPQIMRKAGVNYFLTQKISWNQFNKFPHHTFLWEGIDGTRIFTHFPPADTYNATMEPEQLLYNVHNFREHDRATRSIYLYGHGDGGGGPTKMMLESAGRLKNLEGLPKVEMEKVAEFFPKAEKDAQDPAVWVGELYLEMHRGTYTTQARNKRGNRKSEFLLREAEFFDVIAAKTDGVRAEVNAVNSQRAVYDVTGVEAPASASSYLDRAWKLLLVNQFHDIIPGSSIGWVYEDSDRDYATIKELGEGVLEPARESVAASIDTSGCEKPFLVFNSCSFAREEVVSLPDGTPFLVQAPACGYAVVDATKPRAVGSFAQPVEAGEEPDELWIDNGLVQIVFDKQGLLTSVWDHRESREVIAPGRRGNIFQLHKDYPNNWDAWDVDLFYTETCEDLTGLESIKFVEQTQLRATVRIVRKFGRSTITQDVVVVAGSPRIDFRTEVDWQENHRFLKVAFPVDIHSARASYEIQYGYTERPTHWNTSWDMARFEVCAQKWVDLSEGNYGVALLNDCKYGHDILGNVMRISLLRAPTTPDPRADRGRHEFTYSLLPHWFGPRSGGVVPHAYSLNIPLQVVPATPHPGKLAKSGSFFDVDRAGTIIEAIKHAEKEDAVIVRLYEAHGTRGPVTLRTTLPFTKAFTADLMERTLEKLEFVDGHVKLRLKPFEIVTLKFQ